MENNTLCNRHSLGVNNHTKMYVTYTRIYGWSDYGGESSYQPRYRLENMMWMTLLVYDYIIPGEKLKENKTLNSDVVETLVVNSLDLSLRDTIRQRKKNWIFAFLISIGVVVIEAILLTVSGISIEQMGDSLYISLLMLLFASWLCIFAKELLPTYYDTNKVNFVSQGIFRIHMAGLSFNNANWGYVLTVFRVFTLGTAILYPIICYISFLVGGISLWNTVKYPAIIILLIGMLVTTYIVGKKYE